MINTAKQIKSNKNPLLTIVRNERKHNVAQASVPVHKVTFGKRVYSDDRSSIIPCVIEFDNDVKRTLLIPTDEGEVMLRHAEFADDRHTEGAGPKGLPLQSLLDKVREDSRKKSPNPNAYFRGLHNS